MSDQAESQRTFSCTRLLYIPISTTQTRTMTPIRAKTMDRTSVAIQESNSRRRYHKEEAHEMQRRIQLRLNFTIRQREAVNRQAHVVITKASRFRVSLRVPSWPW